MSLPTAVTDVDHEPLADSGVRTLLEQYVALSGAELLEVGNSRYELQVPVEDRVAFGQRVALRIAFSVEALQDDPNAEMAIAGSLFVEQLIAAVRRRGDRRAFGLVPATVSPGPDAAQLPIPVLNGEAGIPVTQLTQHPVGRLTARVTIRAGASLVEHLPDSSMFDLATGTPLPNDVAGACEAATVSGHLQNLTAMPRLPATKLVELMLGDLQQQLAPEIERLRAESEKALALELARIDRYYTTLLADMGGTGTELPDADTRHVFESEHERRRKEEIGRHDLRATVHPVQLAEWGVALQRADWKLTSRDGHSATTTAQRVLLGEALWTLACPTCGNLAPTALVVCHTEHAGCDRCATRCGVCTTGFCREHGLAACHVDDAPACSTHARTCPSCREAHCTSHEGRCADGAHAACTVCLAACAHCGRIVCEAHATYANPAAPRGVRRLCSECVRHCEGGTGEVVGPDEVKRCASCERVICEKHQVICAVDHQVHCSSHIRRSDRTRRLVCEYDRASCAYEPNSILARDEVTPCATCGKVACTEHSDVCVEDGQRHCTTHLVALRDGGGKACQAHHTLCYIDGIAYSLTGTQECPVCARRACKLHRNSCSNCGRSVCTTDQVATEKGRCRTCTQLAPIADPDDLLIQAASHALKDAKAKSWRVARDSTHHVVELDLGWTRRIVFTARHGSDVPELVVRHSLLGSKRVTPR